MTFDAAVTAIIDGDIELLKRLLRERPELVRERSKSDHRATLLHYLAANGVEDELQRSPPNAPAIARVLLEAGAEVDAPCEAYGGHHSTTLDLLVSSCHPAAAGVQVELVEALVRGGANPNGANGDGSPLRTAIDFGYTAAAKKLHELGARIDHPIAAAVVGTIEELDEQLAKATTPHALEHALINAAAHGRRDVVEYLLTKDPDLSVKEPVYGGKAIGMAKYPHPAAGRPNGNPEIATLLRRAKRFAPAAVKVERKQNGDVLLTSPKPLGPYPPALGAHLERWAIEAGERPFLLERRDGEWRGVTYAEALARVKSIAQWLLDRRLTAKTPVLLLSDNSVAHALVQLAAMHVGIPAAPVSPAYSLMSKDFAKLRLVVDALQPGAVFHDDDARFEPALEELPARTRLSFREASSTIATGAVDAAFAALTPDSIAKILFTSGSTGTPKGVVNTQRMLCSNQQAIAETWPFLDYRAPVVVDWLPWSHTFGGNHNFNMVLRAGGTLYIDNGKPAPGAFDKTIAALEEISPTMYFNVPRGFELLAGALENDHELAKTFFRELDVLFYAAAALPQATWSRLTKVTATIGVPPGDVAFVAAWGSTETSPLVTQVHFPIDRAGVIGLPAPGCELKLAAAGPGSTKTEMRVRGPNVTPGYWSKGEVVPAPRDDEGFLPTGDAGRFEDPAHPERGVVFDGRIAENFKLASGTWVSVGELRVMLLDACAPLVTDAVIAGENRDFIGILLFPTPSATPDAIADRLAAHNASHPANSQVVRRARILREPPSIDAGEITDKGYINQRAVLDRRAADVDALFADPCPADVIEPRR